MENSDLTFDYIPNDEVVKVRIWHDRVLDIDEVTWYVDGTDSKGGYTELCFEYPTWQDALFAVPFHIADYWPQLCVDIPDNLM